MNLHVCIAYRVVKHGNVVFPLNIDESIAVPMEMPLKEDVQQILRFHQHWRSGGHFESPRSCHWFFTEHLET